METAWKRSIGTLSNANGDEFERTVLHYLRVIWPAMIQAPRLQRLDRFGVDLCLPDSDTHFSVVVQAKGFKVDEQLTESQVTGQILPSIKKFRESPLICDEYILLHNRKGDDRELASIIQAELDQLILCGKAKSALLYDLSKFMKKVREFIDYRIRNKLKARSIRLLQQHEYCFHFGNIYVPIVPLKQLEWNPSVVLKDVFDEDCFDDISAAKLIASPRAVRFSMLIGAFGIGKTTTVLRAAEASDLVVIYVPAYTILRKNGSQGTNFLLRNINEDLNLLEDLPPDSAEELDDIVGAALGRILRQPNDQFVLVIDGLDEHSFYGTPFGLQWLANELSDLRCPIVLTTRREHFLSLIGNYGLAVENLSKKGGGKRVVNMIQLGSWSSVQAKSLLMRVIAITQNNFQREQIEQLLIQLDDENSGLSKRLLSHPLFLQITLDLIVDGEEWLIDDDDQLLEQWTRKKIRRDLSVPRLDDNLKFDIDLFVDSMMYAMSRIASEMQNEEGGSLISVDVFDAKRVVDIVNKSMKKNALNISLDITTILTTSLLIPIRKRRDHIPEVIFFHRVLQDYFARRMVGLTSAE